LRRSVARYLNFGSWLEKRCQHGGLRRLASWSFGGIGPWLEKTEQVPREKVEVAVAAP
jgi:hypothetical protein